MDWQLLGTAISTLGFPIVCVFGMGYYVKYITDQHHLEINAMNAQHREEMSDVTEALNNNTVAIQKLTDYIEIGKESR